MWTNYSEGLNIHIIIYFANLCIVIECVLPAQFIRKVRSEGTEFTLLKWANSYYPREFTSLG